MKKFKLNAVLALVLSLGLASSGSVFASRAEVKRPSRAKKYVVVIRRQNATVSDVKPEELLKAPKLVRHETCRGIGLFVDPISKKLMSQRLQNLRIISMDWTPIIKETFNAKKWEEFPLDTDRLIEKLYENKAGVLNSLRNFLFCSYERGMKDEFIIFSDLINICENIYNQLPSK